MAAGIFGLLRAWMSSYRRRGPIVGDSDRETVKATVKASKTSELSRRLFALLSLQMDTSRSKGSERDLH